MLLLTEVPSYTQRLELLVLQEEFFPRLSALRSSIQTLTDAATELLECEELHTILHLILSTGNHLNSGGYAGSAVGFRIASLLKLPDTKANEPGMDLLHFVAMEAARMQRDLLDFPSKLPHVGPASRIEQAEVEGELRRLAGRLAGARSLGAAGLGPRLPPFLRAAEEELRGTRAAMERLHRTAAAALDFYCEEAAPGGLQELCAVLHGFAGRFLGAVQVPARPARPAPPPPGPRRALTPPPPRRKTGRGSRRGGGGSSWSSSGRSAAPSPPARRGTRSRAPPARSPPCRRPSPPPRPCSGATRPPSCPRCPSRGGARSPGRPSRPPQPPRPSSAWPGSSSGRGPAPPARPALPPPRARRCSASCGAWRPGGRAGPPPAEGPAGAGGCRRLPRADRVLSFSARASPFRVSINVVGPPSVLGPALLSPSPIARCPAAVSAAQPRGRSACPAAPPLPSCTPPLTAPFVVPRPCQAVRGSWGRPPRPVPAASLCPLPPPRCYPGCGGGGKGALGDPQQRSIKGAGTGRGPGGSWNLGRETVRGAWRPREASGPTTCRGSCGVRPGSWLYPAAS
uniref:FH2 domain-containing protein n=1 Tax=Cairina moschata TaxID=8855 RepID=A0A8C3C6Y0_CAIMO